MKKLFSIRYSNATFNFTTLFLRVALSTLMLPHGYDKLVHFAEYKKDFMSFLGTGSTVSFALLVFAEFFCSFFVMIGLLTRAAALILVIAMSVAVFKSHNGEVFGEGEHASLFVIGFLTVVLLGPGKISVDGLIGK